MQVINLDSTGLKLISKAKSQLYLSNTDVNSFSNKEFEIKNGILNFKNKKFYLTEQDEKELSSVIDYIKGMKRQYEKS